MTRETPARPGRSMTLVLITTLLLAATAGSADPTVPRTLIYSHFANAGPLNPHGYSPNQMYAQEMLYEPLVALGPDQTIMPCLARSWEISPDGLVYTFHLREGVRFHDGEPLDAPAVVRNFQAILMNRSRHAWLELTNRIAGFRAVDGTTFELTLTSPYPPALHDLSLPRPYRMLSPAAIPESGSTASGVLRPVGTGPWTRGDQRLGEYDLFVRNRDYWGEAPLLDQILVKVIPDPTSRAVALETREIDLIYGLGQVTYDTFAAFQADPSYRTAVSPPMGTVALAINTGRFPTDDVRVRQAIQHLTDKKSLLAGITLDTQPKADFLFSPAIMPHGLAIRPYAFDLEQASRLLDDAGWVLETGARFRSRDGRELRVDVHYIGNDAAQRAIAEVLQGQAARVGMRYVLVGEEEDLFLRRQRDGEFGMIMNPTWGPPFEPHAVLGSMRLPSHADYQAQLGLPDKTGLDRDITTLLETPDAAEAERLYARILTLLHEEAVYLPLHHTCLFAIFRTNDITGFTFGPGKTKYPFEVLNLNK